MANEEANQQPLSHSHDLRNRIISKKTWWNGLDGKKEIRER